MCLEHACLLTILEPRFANLNESNCTWPHERDDDDDAHCMICIVQLARNNVGCALNSLINIRTIDGTGLDQITHELAKLHNQVQSIFPIIIIMMPGHIQLSTWTDDCTLGYSRIDSNTIFPLFLLKKDTKVGGKVDSCFASRSDDLCNWQWPWPSVYPPTLPSLECKTIIVSANDTTIAIANDQ